MAFGGFFWASARTEVSSTGSFTDPSSAGHCCHSPDASNLLMDPTIAPAKFADVTGFGPSVRCKIQPPLDMKILSLATTKDKGRYFKKVALPSPTLDKSIFSSRNVKKLCSGDSLADLNSFFQKCLANRISTHYQLQITTVSTLPSQRDRVQKTPNAEGLGELASAIPSALGTFFFFALLQLPMATSVTQSQGLSTSGRSE